MFVPIHVYVLNVPIHGTKVNAFPASRFSGVATLGGPPLAGSLYDMTKSYTIPFIVVGTCLAISGLMLFPIPAIQR